MESLSQQCKLAPGDSLLNTDDVSRYCSPNNYNRVKCEPKLGAFQIDAKDNTISVNRLQFHHGASTKGAVDLIRQELLADHYTLRQTGRFVVFKVGTAKQVAAKAGYPDISFIFTPRPPVDSHASIGTLPDGVDESTEVATDLKRAFRRLITHTYPGLLPQEDARA